MIFPFYYEVIIVEIEFKLLDSIFGNKNPFLDGVIVLFRVLELSVTMSIVVSFLFTSLISIATTRKNNYSGGYYSNLVVVQTATNKYI